MRILGVDPGLAKLGWALAEYDGRVVRFERAGVLVTRAVPKGKRAEAHITKMADKMRRVDELAQGLRALVTEGRIDRLAHEAASLGFHQSLTLFDLGLVFGLIRATALALGVPLVELRPSAIKRALAMDSEAEKDDVVAAARRAFPELAPHWPAATGLHEHMADASGAAAAGALLPASCAL